MATDAFGRCLSCGRPLDTSAVCPQCDSHITVTTSDGIVIARCKNIHVYEMKYPDPKDVAPSCDALGCDHGWIHHQHPLKPPGVSMCTTPCEKCNADGKKLDPSASIGLEERG